jgi:hypothetical protein
MLSGKCGYWGFKWVQWSVSDDMEKLRKIIIGKKVEKLFFTLDWSLKCSFSIKHGWSLLMLLLCFTSLFILPFPHDRVNLFVFSCSNNVKKFYWNTSRPNSPLMYSLVEGTEFLSWNVPFTSTHSFSFRLNTQQQRFISSSWAQTCSLKLRLLCLSAQ